MSKAALIIDMPKNCYDCPCCYFSRETCQVNYRDLEEDCGNNRPPWCPLCEVLDEYDVQAGYVENIRLKPKEEN